MSKIVDFRNRVVEAIATEVPELRHVDWYDGMFDVEDVKTWGGDAPAAYVAVLNVPTDPHTTGEMLADLRVIVVVVTQDQYEAREADAQNWEFIERIAIMANRNAFGDPNAAPAENVSFKRMRHPDLRREAVGIGIVEWASNITIGVNSARERDELLGYDGVNINMPDKLSGGASAFGSARERYEFEEDAS